jgi:hypothetical protein
MEVRQMCWGSRCDYLSQVPKKTSYATPVVKHENVINAGITVIQEMHSNWNGSKFPFICVQKPLLWTAVYPILQPKIMPELYFTPFIVEIYNISAHLDSRYERVIQYQFLSNILTKTFYVKHKMMASIKKLQYKLNKKETHDILMQ